MNVKEAYQILRLRGDADVEEVKASYRKLAFELHPDLNPSPQAAEQFQRVNEAYVLLKKAIEDGDAKFKPKDGRRRPTYSRKEAGARGAGPDRAKSGAESASGPETTAGPHSAGAAGAQSSGAAESASESQTSGFYRKEEEVLQDILKDPFARQVFEDIYREIQREGGKGVSPVPKKRKKLNLQWGDKKVGVDLSDGVSGAMRKWLRNQLDDETTMHLPAQHIRPGTKVRLQIERGLSGGEKKTVEVVIPQDFVIGRPIRLKGLGRKLGPWTGDLYLKLLAK